MRPCPSHVAHLPETLPLERGVAHGQDLVDDEDLRLEMGGHRKGQAHVHAARVALHRRVDELADLGERDDLVELSVDLGLSHAEDGAAEIDVLEPGELLVEAGADLEQRPDPPVDLAPDPSSVR